MKKIEVERVADYGQAFNATMAREYGSIYAPQSCNSGLPSNFENMRDKLHRGRLSGMPQETSLVKPQEPHNLALLTGEDAVGHVFGVMTKRSFQTGQRLVRAGVITNRTSPGKLHILPLLESGVPLNQFAGIDALGRIMVDIGGLLQRPGVGNAAADRYRNTPSELGHALQGISALTDSSTLAAIQHNMHVAHDWNTGGFNEQGIPVVAPGPAAALTARANNISLFTVQTDHGEVQNGFLPELVITNTTQDYILVDHASIEDQLESMPSGVRAEELAVGMGLVAAGSQLEQRATTLQDRVMGIMRAI